MRPYAGHVYKDRLGEPLKTGDRVDGFSHGGLRLPNHVVIGFDGDYVVISGESGRTIRKYEYNLQKCDSDLAMDEGL